MPLVYNSYGCKFKCGQKHTSNYYRMVKHEDMCFLNPNNRTCLTCKNIDKFNGYPGYYPEPSELPYVSCKIHYEYLEEEQFKILEAVKNRYVPDNLHPLIKWLTHRYWTQEGFLEEICKDKCFNLFKWKCPFYEEKIKENR